MPEKKSTAAPRGKTVGNPQQANVRTTENRALETATHQVVDPIVATARRFHALSPEQLKAITDRAFSWMAGRWQFFGMLVSIVLYAVLAVVWALMGITAALASTAVLFVATVVGCLVFVPRIAEASWKNEPLKAHVYGSCEAYITSFFCGFGMGSFPGAILAAGLYLLFR